MATGHRIRFSPRGLTPRCCSDQRPCGSIVWGRRSCNASRSNRRCCSISCSFRDAPTFVSGCAPRCCCTTSWPAASISDSKDPCARVEPVPVPALQSPARGSQLKKILQSSYVLLKWGVRESCFTISAEPRRSDPAVVFILSQQTVIYSASLYKRSQAHQSI